MLAEPASPQAQQAWLRERANALEQVPQPSELAESVFARVQRAVPAPLVSLRVAWVELASPSFQQALAAPRASLSVALAEPASPSVQWALPQAEPAWQAWLRPDAPS